MGIYNLLTNISEGTAFLLQGLTYNETLQFENKRIACNMILCWTPPPHREIALDTFLDAVAHDVRNIKPQPVRDNLTSSERHS